MKKYTQEELKKMFAAKGLVFLPDPPINKKYHYIGSCGHDGYITLGNLRLKQSSRCLKCANELKSIDEIRKEFESRGCILLSTTYENVRTKLRYIAKCGHENIISYGAFHGLHQGDLCSRCAGGRRLTIDEVRADFAKRGCVLITEQFENVNQRLEYVAKCGHQSITTYASFRMGNATLCKECGLARRGLKRRLSQQQVEEEFKKRGCVLLSKYQTVDTPVEYIAKCGHKSVILPTKFLYRQDGLYCKDCQKSSSERLIGELLAELKIKYTKQKRIGFYPHYQYLDYYLDDFNVAIEYNGKQHYELSWSGSKTEEELKHNKERDERKADWCKSHGIKLICIDGRKRTYKNMDSKFMESMLSSNGIRLST